MYGWVGRILRVNLSDGTVSFEALKPDMAQKFVGGNGLGTKILYDEMNPRADALGPDNKLIFATGPLTGTGAVCGSRYMVITKSPLTGCIACSNSGGYFGPELKFAGYDAMVFEGKAAEPVYLSIVDDHVEIKSAKHLWGKDVPETEKMIRAEVDNPWDAGGTSILSIGSAGERLAKVACIMNDTSRALGRSGVGAVMGSKNLKAVAVRGTKGVQVHDGKAFKKEMRAFLKDMQDIESYGWQSRFKFGTWVVVQGMVNMRMLPTKNFQAGFIEGVPTPPEMREQILVKERSCFSCPFAGGRGSKVTDPDFAGEGEGPEHESYTMLGPNCGVTDLAAVTKANYICNETGMDTISAGGAIACAMELSEKGYIPEKDLPFPLKFGDKHAVVKLTEMMAKREGFGERLAEGSYRLAEHYGHPEIAMTVKKQDMPALHPQGYQGLALAYATSNRGACHTKANLVFSKRLEWEGQAEVVKKGQDYTSLVDAAGACWSIYSGVHYLDDHLVAALEACTGAGYSKEKAMQAGERIFNLQRIFNLRAGITGKEDTLPKRLLETPLLDGDNEGKVVMLNEMLPEYYRLRGWDVRGVPTPEKLEELGLMKEGGLL
ncbi:MAG: aldehyde ferredoxin oxidoreductase family protein [Deltaproteobacteria bacterium]|nr:aldehyde ferredoxin oxidoreductase family protein [Deltaproteobacteria bacterium]